VKKFLFSYRYQGDEYSFDIPAETQKEAEFRLKQMQTAKYDGEVMATVPAELGWLAKLVVWWKNL
jgi:hypothetical protein